MYDDGLVIDTELEEKIPTNEIANDVPIEVVQDEAAVHVGKEEAQGFDDDTYEKTVDNLHDVAIDIDPINDVTHIVLNPMTPLMKLLNPRVEQECHNQQMTMCLLI